MSRPERNRAAARAVAQPAPTSAPGVPPPPAPVGVQLNPALLASLAATTATTPTVGAEEAASPAPAPAVVASPSVPPPAVVNDVPATAQSPATAPVSATTPADLLQAARPVLPEQKGVLDLLSTLINNQRQVSQVFLLYVVPEDAHPRTEEYGTVEQLITAIRRYDGQTCYLAASLGYRFTITRGPFRYLRTPFGAALPLFDPVATSDAEEAHGWMGPPLLDPAQLIPQRPPDIDEEPMAAATADESHAAPASPLPRDEDETSPFTVGGGSGE